MDMKRLVAILLLVSSALFAEPFTHEGVFANAALGLGYASFENTDGEASLTADGLGAKIHGKLGFFVVRDLALHANLGYVMYSNFREARYGLPLYVDHDFYVMSSVYLGLGATYYIPKWQNMFISGTIGTTGYSLNTRREYGNTGLKALTMAAEIGKEWWVSERIGLGASVAFETGDYWSDRDGVFRSSSLMLLFSVTFN
jgi:hypothetical protein